MRSHISRHRESDCRMSRSQLLIPSFLFSRGDSLSRRDAPLATQDEPYRNLLHADSHTLGPSTRSACPIHDLVYLADEVTRCGIARMVGDVPDTRSEMVDALMASEYKRYKLMKISSGIGKRKMARSRDWTIASDLRHRFNIFHSFQA
jgi:hypothetical protein